MGYETGAATTCKHCGAAIVFARTNNGKMMPCEPAVVGYVPDAQGKQVVLGFDGVVLRCRVTGGASSGPGVGRVPHFAACASCATATGEPKRDTKREVDGQQSLFGAPRTKRDGKGGLDA